MPDKPKRLGIINGAHLPSILGGQHVKFEDGYVEIDDYIRDLIRTGSNRVYITGAGIEESK